MFGRFAARCTPWAGAACALLLLVPTVQTPPSSTPPTAGSAPGLEIRADVQVEASDGNVLTLDAYLPERGLAHPAMVLVHGGSWAGGDKSDVASLAAGLAGRGWGVFAVNYRLGVEQLARQASDVRDTVRWVREHARDLRVDPDAITLLGASAGGHLAALAATQARGDSRVAAVAAWSGIFDLAALAPRDGVLPPECSQSCQEIFGVGFLTGLLGCALEECGDRYRQGSPVTHVSASAPPMFLANSTGDAVPPDQAREMAAKLRRAGVEVETAIIEGSEHGYDVGARTLDRTLAFLTDRRLEEDPGSSDDSGPGLVWIGVGVVAVVALIGGAAIAMRARR